MGLFSDFFDGMLSEQLDEARHISAMRGAFSTVKKRQDKNACKISNLEGRKERLRKTREFCVGNEGLLNQAIENLKENGIRVHIVKTKSEAISFVLDEIGDEKLVVKSKSNVTKEIDLTKELESRGIEVIETDIGDRIIQLGSERPSHPTGPASHLTRYDVARIVSKHFKEDVEPDPETLTKLLRDEIAGYIKEAGVGITGANAVTAEEGSILLVHNEGNIIEVMMRPKKHIIITGIDKIYPNLDEAINMAKLQTFYATGAVVTSYMNILGGPSKTADIEKKLFKGIHGPEEICLILLDNKRSEIFENGFGELLYCIGCGNCLLHCPVYNVEGNKFGNNNNLGGRGVVYSTISENPEVDGIYSCVTCGRCRDNCPVRIDIPAFIKKLRREYPNRKKLSEPHLELLYSILRLEVFILISRIMHLHQNKDV